MSAREEAAGLARQCLGDQPYDLAIVLGSGLGSLTGHLSGSETLPYQDIPGFAPPTVVGHGGRLWAGDFAGWRLLVFQGRFHLYEGYRAAEVARTVQLAADLGCPRILLTNAAGGVRPEFHPGDFMLIRDHLNLTGDNPLRGCPENPFIDLTRLYRNDLYADLALRAGKLGLRLHQGVLVSLLGPSYETPAEVRMVSLLGGDAVSMSTVPEAIMAGYLGLEVVALSLIANHAAGLSPEPLSHDEVLAAGRLGARHFHLLVAALIDVWRASLSSPA